MLDVLDSAKGCAGGVVDGLRVSVSCGGELKSCAGELGGRYLCSSSSSIGSRPSMESMLAVRTRLRLGVDRA